MNPARFTGLAPRQTRRFIAEHIEPVRQRYAAEVGGDADLKV
jgi:hypothetical protein